MGEHPDLENLEEERILEEIQIVKRDSAGYVETVQIGSETYSGDAVRYALGVPSPAFSLEEDGDEIRCVTYGRGHGYRVVAVRAGLMAENGAAAEEILKHYFKIFKSFLNKTIHFGKTNTEVINVKNKVRQLFRDKLVLVMTGAWSVDNRSRSRNRKNSKR